MLPWLEKHGDAQPQLVNMYGITETTVNVTYYPLTMADTEARTSPIGAAIPDLQVFILDRDLHPVPIGVAGEIYVAGAGLGREYPNQPALTAERFVPNPFSDEPGARLYKSGDLARYLPDGNIEYLWRMDDQVKLRGFRIELGEIEAVLSQHPGVQNCVVIAREDIPGDKQLAAYFISKLNEHVGPSELRRYLKKSSPSTWCRRYISRWIGCHSRLTGRWIGDRYPRQAQPNRMRSASMSRRGLRSRRCWRGMGRTSPNRASEHPR